jgi:hypothetical protein
MSRTGIRYTGCATDWDWAQLSEANMGQMAFHFARIDPNRFHQNRTVSGVMSIPRSCSRSSTFLDDSG